MEIAISKLVKVLNDAATNKDVTPLVGRAGEAAAVPSIPEKQKSLETKGIVKSVSTLSLSPLENEGSSYYRVVSTKRPANSSEDSQPRRSKKIKYRDNSSDVELNCDVGINQIEEEICTTTIAASLLSYPCLASLTNSRMLNKK